MITDDCGCDVVAAVAGEFPTISKEKLTISIYYAHGDQRIDTHWSGRDGGQWLWTLRDAGQGIHKGAGYCATATDALKMAFAAASFVVEKTVAPPPPRHRAKPEPVAQEERVLEPLEEALAPVAQSGRHYRTADARAGR